MPKILERAERLERLARLRLAICELHADAAEGERQRIDVDDATLHTCCTDMLRALHDAERMFRFVSTMRNYSNSYPQTDK